MKRIITIAVLIAMIAVLPMAAFAAENEAAPADNYDSLKISDEVMDQICGNAFQKVIKVYTGIGAHGFSHVHSIDELFEYYDKKGYVYGEFYALQSNEGGIIYRELLDNSYVNLVDNAQSRQPQYIKVFFDNAGAAKLSEMFSDIAVYNTYFLFSKSYSMWGVNAIYYKTNKGDFIYTKGQDFGNSEYLFPIQDFCELQSAILKAIQKNGQLGTPKLPNISYVWDLSKYDIHSDSFAPLSNTENEDDEKPNSAKIYLWVGIPCAAVLVIAGVVLGTRKMRKKAAADNTEDGSVS